MSKLLQGVAVTLLVAVIQAYRGMVSPFLGRHCRFEPSCSAFALDALQRHGLARGGWLSMRRVVSCHPFHRGGFDPVP